MSKNLKDLEKDLMGPDLYELKVEEKINQTMLVGNTLESKSQSRLSKMGGKTL